MRIWGGVEIVIESPRYSDLVGVSGGARDFPLSGTITAVDRAYEVCAEYECAEGAKAGLYLFYNEDAYVGVQAEDSHFFLRIVNDHNKVTTYKSLDGKEWNVVEEGVDVSEYHHNVYKGFFALRPSVLVSEGATVKAFDYKVL